jgi:CAAX protease family protein
MNGDTNDSFTTTAFFFEAMLGVGALAVGRMIGVDPLATVTITAASLGDIVQAIGWGILATLPLILGMFLIERLPLRSLTKIRRFINAQLVPLFQSLSYLELGAISFAAGFGEETLFRGLIQVGLAEWAGQPYGIVIGLVVASIAFGLCHSITPMYAILAIFAGAYFGIIFLLTGNLLAPLVAHALYDFLALIYLTRRRKES